MKVIVFEVEDRLWPERSTDQEVPEGSPVSVNTTDSGCGGGGLGIGPGGRGFPHANEGDMTGSIEYVSFLWIDIGPKGSEITPLDGVSVKIPVWKMEASPLHEIETLEAYIAKSFEGISTLCAFPLEK